MTKVDAKGGKPWRHDPRSVAERREAAKSRTTGAPTENVPSATERELRQRAQQAEQQVAQMKADAQVPYDQATPPPSLRDRGSIIERVRDLVPTEGDLANGVIRAAEHTVRALGVAGRIQQLAEPLVVAAQKLVDDPEAGLVDAVDAVRDHYKHGEVSKAVGAQTGPLVEELTPDLNRVAEAEGVTKKLREAGKYGLLRFAQKHLGTTAEEAALALHLKALERAGATPDQMAAHLNPKELALARKLAARNEQKRLKEEFDRTAAEAANVPYIPWTPQAHDRARKGLPPEWPNQPAGFGEPSAPTTPMDQQPAQKPAAPAQPKKRGWFRK